MNARQLGLACGLLGVAIALCFAPRPAAALGRDGRRVVVPNYRDEGNTGIPYNVSCSSTAWTAIPVSSDTIRRAIIFQTAQNAVAGVCVTTTTNAADACNDATPGVDLSTGAALTDYSGMALTCRSRSTGAVKVKGYWTRDTGDYGDVARPR